MWETLGTFELSENWIYTIPVVGELFRVKSFFITNPNAKYLKATIGQGFFDGEINIFDLRRLTYREEKEFFLFSFPLGLSSHSIFIKRLDNNSDTIPWTIEIERFIHSSIEDDFLNFITARFGANFMAIFPRQKESKEFVLLVSEQGGAKMLLPNETQKILSARIDRRTIEILNNSSSMVTIGLQVNDKNEIITQQVELEPLAQYEFPQSGDGAIYIGDVYASSPELAAIFVVEKVAVDKNSFSSENYTSVVNEADNQADADKDKEKDKENN